MGLELKAVSHQTKSEASQNAYHSISLRQHQLQALTPPKASRQAV